MSSQEPVAEPAATQQAPVETPGSELAPIAPASESQPESEPKEPAKIVKRKSIFNPFGRRKEEQKKEEQADGKATPTETSAESATPTKTAEEPAAEKRKAKGFNLFSRVKVNGLLLQNSNQLWFCHPFGLLTKLMLSAFDRALRLSPRLKNPF